MQGEQHNITISSAEVLTKMLLKEEKKKEKEYCTYEGKWSNFIINNNKILGELKKGRKNLLC